MKKKKTDPKRSRSPKIPPRLREEGGVATRKRWDMETPTRQSDRGLAGDRRS